MHGIFTYDFTLEVGQGFPMVLVDVGGRLVRKYTPLWQKNLWARGVGARLVAYVVVAGDV